MQYQRIKNLREDKDFTQKEVAKILSCSQQVYSDYELGKLDIPTQTLIRIADIYGVSTDYLLNRTDVKRFVPKIKE